MKSVVLIFPSRIIATTSIVKPAVIGVKTPLPANDAANYLERMMNHKFHIVPFLLPVCASILLSSCIVPGYPDDGHYQASGGGYVTYTTLPDTYVGSAYYHDGRYYSGGRYQTGHYSDRGRSYSDRYYYNGKYYYGGNYQRHEAKATGRGLDSQRAHGRTTGQVPAAHSRY